ncbi:MAG: hypothetical protein ACT452_16820 [Microthrixaceae bacterium]
MKEQSVKPYRQLDAAYQQIQHRHTRRPIPGLGDLDAIVNTIRHDTPDCTDSDEAIRDLLSAGRTAPEANTVALHALAPGLAYRISRSATAEYHQDALTELSFVLLYSYMTGARLAHLLVNRAHRRIWRTVRSDRTLGGKNAIEIVPREPDRLQLLQDATAGHRSLADVVIDRVSLQRFCDAVDFAVEDGTIPSHAWDAYRETRLRRAVVVGLPPTTGQQRVLAHRAARRLSPIVEAHLGVHAA